MYRFAHRWLAGLIVLLVWSANLRAELKFPQLTAIARETPANVSPGSPLTYRFSITAGTSPLQSLTLVFTGGLTTFRTLRTTSPADGVFSVTVPNTWTNETYTLSNVLVHDTWGRHVTYNSQGRIQASVATGVGGETYYGGPETHTLDFASLGFILTGSNPVVRPRFTSLFPASTAPVSPGGSVRFTFTGESGPVPLTNIVFTFRLGSALIHQASVDTTQPSGEFSIPVVPAMANGTYRLISIQTLDRDGRSILYGDFQNISDIVTETMDNIAYRFGTQVVGADMTRAAFTVTGASVSAPPNPRIETLTLNTPNEVTPGTTVRYNYTTSGAVFPIRRVTLQITGPYGAWRSFTSESASGTFDIPITADWASGAYTVFRFSVTDTVGHTAIGGGNTTFTVRAQDIAPYFVQQPPAETPTRAGNEVRLEVYGVGLGPVSYQWYRGEPGDTSTPLTGQPQTGARGALVLRVDAPTTIWVRMTSAGQTIDSGPYRIVLATAPVITRQPISQAVPVGGTTTFSVAASGTGPLRYNWRSTNALVVGSMEQSTLTVQARSMNDSGTVSCEVSDVGGTTRSEVVFFTVLGLDTALHFEDEPADRILVGGPQTVILQGTAVGNPPLRFVWQKNGVDIPRPDHVSYQSRSQATLDLRNVTSSDAGIYRLVVTNDVETLYSRDVQVRFTEAPVITHQPTSPQFTTGALGLAVTAVGVAPLTYQWRKDGVPLADQTRPNLTRYLPDPSIAGNYDVVITNPAGTVTSVAIPVAYQQPVTEPRIIRAPGDVTARAGDTVTFAIERNGGGNCEWMLAATATVLQDSPVNSFTLPQVGASDSGRYQVHVRGPAGSASATFTLTVTPTRSAPAITRQPNDTVVPRGNVAQLNIAVDGQGPFQYHWRRNGAPLELNSSLPYSGADSPVLSIRNFDSAWLGSYDVVVTSTLGTVTSTPARLLLPPPGTEGRLLNLSVRANAGGGNGPLIVGFVLGGGISEDVPILLRAAGPALTGFGVSGTLADPLATLYRGPMPRLANDNWFRNPFVAATAARVGAFPFPTNDVRDAALAPSLAPGAYTVHVTGSAGTSGVALAEIYDATPAAEINSTRPRLLNLSVQTRVTSDAHVIAGFVLGGAQPRKVLVRAIGPSLAAFGVQGVLADPQLVLRNSDALVASNDDWAGDTSVRDAAAASGAFALSSTASKDAALVATLVPGSYTAQVTGAAGASGLVLVEVYEVP